MQRHIEVEPVPGVKLIEVISHSMLRDAWLAHNDPKHKSVNWSILPGATIYAVLDRARGMAWANLQRGIPTTFVLHLMQNSVNRGLGMNEVLRLVKSFDALLKGPDFQSYHRVAWVNMDRVPQLYSKYQLIIRINKFLDSVNKRNGFRSCDPGRILEKMKKGKHKHQQRRWRETEGYHVSDSTMPTYVRYIRRWIDANL